MPYKYNILPKLRKLSVEDYEIAMIFFPEALGVSKSTWEKYIYIKQDDSRELRPEQLMVISSFFECSMEDLINKSLAKSPRNLKIEFEKFKS